MRRAERDIFPPGWLAEELADALRIMRRWRAQGPARRPASPKDRKTR